MFILNHKSFSKKLKFCKNIKNIAELVKHRKFFEMGRVVESDKLYNLVI